MSKVTKTISLLKARHAFDLEQESGNKKQKYFLLSDHQLTENLITVFVFLRKEVKVVEADL